MKTNILHIIDSMPVGGAEKLLVAVIHELPDYNHHLIYLGGSDKLVTELPPDCKVLKLGSTSKWDIPRSIFKVKQYIRKNSIQIVHSHLVMATMVARLACPPDVKLFNTLHSLVGARFFGKGNRLNRLIEKISYKKSHHIIAVSEEVRRDYDQYIGIKGDCHILHNFVDDRYFKKDYKKSAFNGTLRMVTVGNLKPAKNYAYLVEAFKNLSPDIQLDIFGDGPLRDELQAGIDKNKLNIRICGVKDNVHELLRNYDLFVMSSSTEGYGIALMEAMASGMPAAVSDIPALRETIGNKGIFFDLNNTGDFVNKISAIADHKVDLDEYAKHNWEVARKVAAKEKYISSLKSIYGEQTPG